MKHYNFYTVEEFAQDSRFRAWVRNPSAEEDQAWQHWIKTNTHKRPVIEEARAIILSIHPINSENISDRELSHEIQTILQRISEESDDTEIEPIQKHAVSFWLKIAASFALVFLTGWYALNYFRQSAETEKTASLDSYLIEHVNKSEQPLLINLPDNSSVLLSQNSLIRYPREFTGDRRNVFLEGNAFFEVTKNPDKPFYVEAGQLVAKVLGTSFEIRIDPADKQVRIIVRSGRVSVYSNADPTKKNFDDQPNVILTRDEQLIYKNAVSQIQHTRLDSLSMEKLRVPDTYLKFSGTPVATVFSSLAKAYGVKINYEQAEISGCTVTASFTDEPFALKLALICRSIGVEYEIVNNWVTIKGKGCKN